MPITATCTCGKKLKARDEAAGKSGRCPACGNRVTFPDAGIVLDLGISTESDDYPAFGSITDSQNSAVSQPSPIQPLDIDTPIGPLAPANVPPAQADDEYEFLREQYAVVTDRRIVVTSRKTFSLSHLVSFERGEQAPNPAGLLVLGGVGGFMALAGLLMLGTSDLFAGGVVLLLLGSGLVVMSIYLISQQKSTPWLVMSFSSGEKHLISAADPAFINRIFAALTNAIIRQRT